MRLVDEVRVRSYDILTLGREGNVPHTLRSKEKPMRIGVHMAYSSSVRASFESGRRAGGLYVESCSGAN